MLSEKSLTQKRRLKSIQGSRQRGLSPFSGDTWISSPAPQPPAVRGDSLCLVFLLRGRGFSVSYCQFRSFVWSAYTRPAEQRFFFCFFGFFKVSSWPSVGLELMGLRSRITCSTDWASQVPLKKAVLMTAVYFTHFIKLISKFKLSTSQEQVDIVYFRTRAVFNITFPPGHKKVLDLDVNASALIWRLCLP